MPAEQIVDLAFDVLLAKFSELERHVSQANTRATGQSARTPFIGGQQQQQGGGGADQEGSEFFAGATAAGGGPDGAGGSARPRGGGVLLDLD